MLTLSAGTVSYLFRERKATQAHQCVIVPVFVQQWQALKDSDTQCNDEQIQGTSGQKAQDGFTTSSGALPYILLIAWEEGHLGVGLYPGSLSSQLLKVSPPFCIP